jgi:serine protease Do
MREGKVVRPFLGIQMVTLSPAIASQQGVTVNEGALVTGVVDGSPAALSGLRPDDVIVEVDGKKVTDTDGVTTAINSKKPGDDLDLVVVRGRDRVQLSPTLTEREST